MKSASITSLLFLSFMLFYLFILSPIRCTRSVDRSRYLYVSHISGDFVSVIDPETNKVIDTIRSGKGPTSVAHDPANSIIYISNFFSNDVTVYNKSSRSIVDCADGELLKTIDTRFCAREDDNRSAE